MRRSQGGLQRWVTDKTFTSWSFFIRMNIYFYFISLFHSENVPCFVNIFPRGNNGRFNLYGQYNGDRWPGDTRSQGTSSHSIAQPEYSEGLSHLPLDPYGKHIPLAEDMERPLLSSSHTKYALQRWQTLPHAIFKADMLPWIFPGLPEISRVTWQLCISTYDSVYGFKCSYSMWMLIKPQPINVQYIPRSMHMIRFVAISEQFCPYFSGALHWHWGNHRIATLWLPHYQWSNPEEYE